MTKPKVCKHFNLCRPDDSSCWYCIEPDCGFTVWPEREPQTHAEAEARGWSKPFGPQEANDRYIEQRTSKPLRDPHDLLWNMREALLYLESRIEHFDPVNVVTDRAQYVLLPDYFRRAIAEIERLTAELKGTKDELYSVDKAAKELGAERDRLAADLKECQHAAIQSGLYGMSECKRLEAERDRLADELQQLRACFVNDPLDIATALRAERDRLRAELERTKSEAGFYTTLAEIDRLRAALERIKSADPETPLGAFYIFAKETAGEALAGAAVETKPTPLTDEQRKRLEEIQREWDGPPENGEGSL